MKYLKIGNKTKQLTTKTNYLIKIIFCYVYMQLTNKILLSSFLLIFIDSIYLQLIKRYFTNQIQSIQLMPMKINYIAAILCYICLIIAINYFIIIPKKSILDAFILGLVIYGVYETTNMALFNKWKWTTVLIDTLWGATLFALTTYLVYHL